MLLVDYGNLYVASVTDVGSAIYGERVTVQEFRVVLHNLIPGNDGGWNESFLDWLMGTINYDEPGYNDVFEAASLPPSSSSLHHIWFSPKSRRSRLEELAMLPGNLVRSLLYRSSVTCTCLGMIYLIQISTVNTSSSEPIYFVTLSVYRPRTGGSCCIH